MDVNRHAVQSCCKYEAMLAAPCLGYMLHAVANAAHSHHATVVVGPWFQQCTSRIAVNIRAVLPLALSLQGFDVTSMWADLDKLEASAAAARVAKEKLAA